MSCMRRLSYPVGIGRSRDGSSSSTPSVPVQPVLLLDGVQVQPHCASAHPHGRAAFPVPLVHAHVCSQVQPQEPLADTHGRAALSVSPVPAQLHPARCAHGTLARATRRHHPAVGGTAAAIGAALHALSQTVQPARRAEGTHTCGTPRSLSQALFSVDWHSLSPVLRQFLGVHFTLVTDRGHVTKLFVKQWLQMVALVEI